LLNNTRNTSHKCVEVSVSEGKGEASWPNRSQDWSRSFKKRVRIGTKGLNAHVQEHLPLEKPENFSILPV